MDITVTFALSAKARNEMFVKAGVMPAEQQKMLLDAAQTTPEQRQLLVEIAALRGARLDQLVLKEYSSAGYNDFAASNLYLDDTPTPDEVFAIVQQMIADKKERDAAAAAKQRDEREAWAARERERKAQWEAEQERKKAEAEAEADRRIAAEAEKERWIAAHGSDQLKRAFARGHDCQRLYVRERATQEMPGYIVDFEDAAQWKDRSCPSVAALDEAERVEGQGFDGIAVEIVWLTEPAQVNKREYWEAPDPFEECEAVVVRRYLGRYDAVKET